MWADMAYLGKKTQWLVESYHRTLEITRRPKKYFCILANIFEVNAYLVELGMDVSGPFKVFPRR